VILLAALANFHGLMEISAAPGAAAFGTVVILTMLAAMSFDPRRGWDMEATGTQIADRAPPPAAEPVAADVDGRGVR